MVTNNMKITVFFALFLFLLLAQVSKAAPAPWGLAINTQTKECAGFWAGDEFVAYKLPEGWKAYFPKYDPETKTTTFETEIGSCDFKKKGDEEKCCGQLGYKYVSDNIGKDQKTILRDRQEFEKNLRQKNHSLVYAIIAAILLFIIAGVIVFKKYLI